MKLNGRRFETARDIQRNRKRCPTALRKMTSTVLLKRRKNDGIAAYVPKKTILKEMSKFSQHFLFDLVREVSDTPRMPTG
jgi:hypothetical protein